MSSRPQSTGKKYVISTDEYFSLSETANVVIASYDGGTVAKASRCVVAVLPGDPSFENISALLNGKITVACLGNTHDSRIYDIVENGFALGDVTFNDGNGITCEIIINDDLYVSMYSNDIGAQHTSDTVNENAIVTVSYDAATEEWSLPENFTGILLSAVCNDGTGGGQTGTDPGATPDTGDDAPVALAAGTVIVSLAVLVIAFVAKRRRSNVA